MNWLDRIRNSTFCRLVVEHQPETPRYSRARIRLRYIIEHGELLGQRLSDRSSSQVEIAVWAPSPERRRYGYYACFRIIPSRNDITYAILFCFYDGMESSPGFRSLESAKIYARDQGFNGGVYEFE